VTGRAQDGEGQQQPGTSGPALLEDLVITRSPSRALGAVLGVLLTSGLLAALVGQHGDGPLGGLPMAVGTVAYGVALVAALVLVGLVLLLVVTAAPRRRGTR
jgi:hypothetical protein